MWPFGKKEGANTPKPPPREPDEAMVKGLLDAFAKVDALQADIEGIAAKAIALGKEGKGRDAQALWGLRDALVKEQGRITPSMMDAALRFRPAYLGVGLPSLFDEYGLAYDEAVRRRKAEKEARADAAK